LWAGPLGGAGNTYKTGRLCGNFLQTYSMVGIINGVMQLSRAWGLVV
jgi:hypothetical protein